MSSLKDTEFDSIENTQMKTASNVLDWCMGIFWALFDSLPSSDSLLSASNHNQEKHLSDGGFPSSFRALQIPYSQIKYNLGCRLRESESVSGSLCVRLFVIWDCSLLVVFCSMEFSRQKY